MATEHSEVTQLIGQTERIKSKMVDNIALAERRQPMLMELRGKSVEAKEAADEFEKVAQQVKKKKLWEHYKLWIILIVVIVIIVVILLVAAGLTALFVTQPWK